MTQTPAPITNPVTLNHKMTTQELAALARELAMAIRDEADILNEYQITAVDYDVIKTNPQFIKIFEGFVTEWNSAINTPERVRIEAAAALEQAMPKLFARMGNKNEALNHVVEVAKFFARAAGIGEVKNAATQQGEKFMISINLGADTKMVIEQQKEPIPAKIIEGTAVEIPLEK